MAAQAQRIHGATASGSSFGDLGAAREHSLRPVQVSALGLRTIEQPRRLHLVLGSWFWPLGQAAAWAVARYRRHQELKEEAVLWVLAAGDFCQRCGVVKQEQGRCKCAI